MRVRKKKMNRRIYNLKKDLKIIEDYKKEVVYKKKMIMMITIILKNLIKK